MTTVAVVGASGFVGSAVVTALLARGHDVLPVRAPRVLSTSRPEAAAADVMASSDYAALVEVVRGVETLVNAAGLSDATSADENELMAANATLPFALARVTAGRARFIHISSAAVQGPAAVLDASDRTAPFSPYSRSKTAGERTALASGNHVVAYRPPGVHGIARRITRITARLARSPLSTVAAPGDYPTPQALIENVGDAVAFLATFREEVPSIVSHPSEDLSVAELLTLLGNGRKPRQIPAVAARGIVNSLKFVGPTPSLAAAARRLELLWLGQAQSASWLTSAGWHPPADRTRWAELGAALAQQDQE